MPVVNIGYQDLIGVLQYGNRVIGEYQRHIVIDPHVLIELYIVDPGKRMMEGCTCHFPVLFFREYVGIGVDIVIDQGFHMHQLIADFIGGVGKNDGYGQTGPDDRFQYERKAVS